MEATEHRDSLEIPPLYAVVVYSLQLIGWALFLAVLSHFWGGYILITKEQIFGTGLSWAGIAAVWFIFAWGAGATVAFIAIGDRYESDESRFILLCRGIWLSINAGIFEEIVYRWLVFMAAMVTIPFVNFITFGLIKWLYVELLVPLANFTTFGALESYLHHPSSWIFGAALVSASMNFSEAHKHLGLIGRINSWFIGMVMFWLMLNYGLLTAIVAHIVYDIVVLGLRALTAERLRWSTRLAYSIMGRT